MPGQYIMSVTKKGRHGGIVVCLRTINLFDVDILPEALLQRRLPGALAAAGIPELLRVLEELGLFPPPLDLGVWVLRGGLWGFWRRAGRAEGGDVCWVGGRVVQSSCSDGL